MSSDWMGFLIGGFLGFLAGVLLGSWLGDSDARWRVYRDATSVGVMRYVVDDKTGKTHRVWLVPDGKGGLKETPEGGK